MPHGFSWATLIFGPAHAVKGLFDPAIVQAVPLFHAVISALILLSLVVIVRGKVLSKGDDILPDAGFSLRNLFEMLMEMIMGLMKDIIGPDYRKYVPLILGIWFYILFANLFGLLPFFAPPTDKWSVTVSMALVVFFATHYFGIRAHGIGYFKHFISPVWPPNVLFILISPLYFTIEIIGHFARILSLSIRLMANMTADHIVVTIFLMLTAPLIPAFFTGLGLIVCFLQAFIFAILATIYFALATAHEGGEEEHGHQAAEAAPAH
jgi:F-type H+-transporting ATPase subunit a